jgi:hypothetical protein
MQVRQGLLLLHQSIWRLDQSTHYYSLCSQLDQAFDQTFTKNNWLHHIQASTPNSKPAAICTSLHYIIFLFFYFQRHSKNPQHCIH